MKIDIITAPVNIGSGKQGAQDGPETLLKAGVTTWLNPHECNIVAGCESHDPVLNIDDAALHAVAAQCKSLRRAVVKSLSVGHLPLILGGDHSLTWGSLAGVMDLYPDAYCIYIDAHGDINTYEGSPSGHVHGMCLSFLSGICDVSTVVPEYTHPTIAPQRIKFYATRSLDPCEQDIINNHHLDVITSDNILTHGVQTYTCQLEQWLDTDEVRHVHLSFDIDAIDPSLAPATGVPEKGGITVQDAVALIETVLASGKTVAIDLVEFNPRLEGRDKTLDAWQNIFNAIARSLSSRTSSK